MYLLAVSEVGVKLSVVRYCFTLEKLWPALAQVKRAFDLNGYVGILYFMATAASLYVK